MYFVPFLKFFFSLKNKLCLDGRVMLKISLAADTDLFSSLVVRGLTKQFFFFFFVKERSVFLGAETTVSLAFSTVRLTFLSCYVLLVTYQRDV